MLRKIKGFVLLAALIFPSALLAQEHLRDVSFGVMPGDELSIRVFTSAGEQLVEVSGTRIVDPSGQIYLPYVGTLIVEGLSAPEIRDRLEVAYSGLYSTPVVEVASRIKVNVTGAVRTPSHYLMDPSSTLIDALARAGGVGSEVDLGAYAASDPERSRFVRDGELYLLDLRPNSPDPSIFSIPIQSGDWIHIPIANRSRMRERVQFWGGVISVFTSTIIMIALLSGN